MSSLDRILPFLRPIEDLLRDPTVTEVMVNCGGRRVFVERSGAIESVPDRTLEIRNLTGAAAIRQIWFAASHTPLASSSTRPLVTNPSTIARYVLGMP